MFKTVGESRVFLDLIRFFRLVVNPPLTNTVSVPVAEGTEVRPLESPHPRSSGPLVDPDPVERDGH